LVPTIFAIIPTMSSTALYSESVDLIYKLKKLINLRQNIAPDTVAFLDLMNDGLLRYNRSIEMDDLLRLERECEGEISTLIVYAKLLGCRIEFDNAAKVKVKVPKMRVRRMVRRSYYLREEIKRLEGYDMLVSAPPSMTIILHDQDEAKRKTWVTIRDESAWEYIRAGVIKCMRLEAERIEGELRALSVDSERMLVS
jgi:hypothetical protein